MIELTCQVCGKVYLNYPSRIGRSKYCSRKCQSKAKERRVKLVCSRCGKVFFRRPSDVNRSQVHYCSKECVQNRVEIICTVCRKKFERPKYQELTAKYCSRECQAKGRVKGSWGTCKVCKQPIWLFPSQSKKYCSLDCKYTDVTPITIRPWQVDKNGYLRLGTTKHPMSTTSGILLQHWYVYYEAAKNKSTVLELKKRGCTLHHINGKRDDNHIENLEIRLPGQHPQGVNAQDAIWFLEQLGYKVEVLSDV